MRPDSFPLPPDHALVVLGSENWNPEDRSLGRERIRSLQLLLPDGERHVRRLDGLGVHGLRDLALLDDDTVALTTGHDLLRLDLRTGEITEWLPPRASDLHELAVEDGRLLVANTAYDEGLVMALDGTVERRVDVTGFRHGAAQPIAHDRPLGGVLPGGPKPVRDDHFHLNQLATGQGGELLALVHHVTGYRPVAHLRHRLTGHGDGGVLEVDGGTIHRLGLRAPHSLRRTADGYAVLDSGRSEVLVLDRGWRTVQRWPTGGWGRGLALGERHWFVGLSPTRKRYLNPGEASGTSAVVALDAADGAVAGRWEVGGVEQIWSVRLVSSTVAERLLASDHPTGS